MIPRALEHLFAHTKGDDSYILSMTFLEVYNERVYDLFANEKAKLVIRETPDHNFHVPGLQQNQVHTQIPRHVLCWSTTDSYSTHVCTRGALHGVVFSHLSYPCPTLR